MTENEAYLEPLMNYMIPSLASSAFCLTFLFAGSSVTLELFLCTEASSITRRSAENMCLCTLTGSEKFCFVSYKLEQLVIIWIGLGL